MKVPLLAVSVLAGSMLTPAQAQLTSRSPIVNSKTPVATKAPALPSDHTPSNLLGGSDDCSTPEGIAGPGPHSFNNTAATTGAQGQANANCNFFGQTGITNDVWFSWTAPGSGAATLTMCGQGVTIDTKVAIYDGSGCPGAAAIACNDDFCGLQSQVGFTAVGGNAYTFQVGNFPGATAGSGTFTVTVSGVQTNDDCSTPTVIAGSGPHPFDTTAATTGAQGQNNANCLFFGSPGIANDLWYTWQAPSNDTFSLKTCNMTGVDSKVAVYDGAGCPVAAAIACNDDFCGLQSTLSFTGVAGNNYTIQMGVFPGASGGPGSFTIDPVGGGGGGACSYDDGSTENSIGLTSGGELAWLHKFGAVGDVTTVSAIQTAWGSAAFPGGSPGNGTPSKVAIWDDPNDDGNPTDCVLLQLVNVTVQNVDTDMLNTYPLAPSVTVNGVFFVGGAIVHLAGQFPAPLDQSSGPSAGRAWACGNTSGTMDFNNLAANDVPPLELDSIGLPGLWLLRGDCGGLPPGLPFCFGDNQDPSVVVDCPCMNFGKPRHGCANSGDLRGALTLAAGSTAADNVVLTVEGTPESVTCLFIKGDALIPGGQVFGDGIRCAGGNLVRFGLQSSSNGIAMYPTGPGDPSLATVGGTPPGSGMTARYQMFYRNADVAFCPPASFNISSGYVITW
jgi:hypothetical protein